MILVIGGCINVVVVVLVIIILVFCSSTLSSLQWAFILTIFAHNWVFRRFKAWNNSLSSSRDLKFDSTIHAIALYHDVFKSLASTKHKCACPEMLTAVTTKTRTSPKRSNYIILIRNRCLFRLIKLLNSCLSTDELLVAEMFRPGDPLEIIDNHIVLLMVLNDPWFFRISSPPLSTIETISGPCIIHIVIIPFYGYTLCVIFILAQN